MESASTGANAGSEVIIADLGLGNLRSVERALERAGGVSRTTSDPHAIRNAARLVVPGQGSFRDGATAISSALGGAIIDFLDAGRPYLGICLGMQLLFERSEEAVELGKVSFGEMSRSDPPRGGSTNGRRLKVPHMGWNRCSATSTEDGAFVLFRDSYHVLQKEAIVAGTTEYGKPSCSGISRLCLLQFHPE